MVRAIAALGSADNRRMLSICARRVSPALWYLALAWCLGRGCSADGVALNKQRKKGQFLLRRLNDFLPGSSVHQTTEQALNERLAKLQQEADFAVTKQSMLMKAEAQKKQLEAMAIIEKEVPPAEVTDTATLAKEVAIQNAQMKSSQQKSQKAAQDSLVVLRDQTEMAVNMSAAYAVRAAEDNVLKAVKGVEHNVSSMITQADLLAKEAQGAANFSQQAAKNSELWVKALPVEDAAGAVLKAVESEKMSIDLMQKSATSARIARMAGNMAIDTIRLMEKAEAYTQEAEADAVKAVSQASQNAQNLNNIRKLIKSANTAALDTISKQSG